MLWRWCRSPSGADRPMTIATLHSGAIAPLDHHLRPVTTISSVASSSSILQAMLLASEDATSGSVMEYAERMVPSSSGVSHRSRTAGRAKWASTSMFPVSGAAQFIASGASIGERPDSSASGAYSRLVSPAPRSPGRNRFQRPRSRACALSSSMTGGRPQGLLCACSATWAWKVASAGRMTSSRKSCTRSRHCSTVLL